MTFILFLSAAQRVHQQAESSRLDRYIFTKQRDIIRTVSLRGLPVGLVYPLYIPLTHSFLYTAK
jgi:hypothetical protein